MDFKSFLNQKISSLILMLSVPGSFRAWRQGYYVSVYSFVKRIESLGIRPRTVLDIGANRGMFSKCLNLVYNDLDIHAFEPLGDCYKDLEMLKMQIRGLHTYNFALGNRNDTSTIYRSSYDYSSSLLPMGELHKRVFPGSAETTAEVIQVKTLDSVFKPGDLHSPVLMKIDVQGYELAVLEGAKRMLEVVDYLVCEVSLRSLYEGQPLFDEVYDFIRAAGFRFRGWVGEVLDPKTGEILQFDALFLRDIHDVTF